MEYNHYRRKSADLVKEWEEKNPIWLQFVIAIVFFFSLGMCIKQAYDLLLLYQSDPIETQIKMTVNEVMEFPAITVCNLNPVRRSRWKKKINDREEQEVKKPSPNGTMEKLSHSERKTAEDFTLKERNIRAYNKLEVNNKEGKIEGQSLFLDENPNKKNRIIRQDMQQYLIELVNENNNAIAVLKEDVKKLSENNADIDRILDDIRYNNSDLRTSVSENSKAIESIETSMKGWEARLDRIELINKGFLEEMERTKEYLTSLTVNLTSITIDKSKNETILEESGRETAKKLPPSKDMEAFNDYLRNIGITSKEDILELGHRKEDFIAICSWQGSICSPSHFDVFQNFMYGNCFTLNTSKIDSNVTGTGPYNGLSLSLYIEQDEYIDRVAPAAGARVVIHDIKHQPFPEDEGFSVAPGYTTAVFLRKSTTETVKPMCDPDVQSFYEHNGTSYRYSQKACNKRCLSAEILRQCHCAGAQFLLDTENTCSPDNTEQAQCVERLQQLSQKNQLPCSCPISCRTTTYNPMISSAIWPAEKYLPSFVEELVGVRHKVLDLFGNVTDFNQFFRKHFLRINIYFQELTEQEVIQRHSYGLESLLSDIGGQLGLWIGVSVATLYESLGTISSLVTSILKWLRIKIRQKNFSGVDSTAKNSPVSYKAATSNSLSPIPHGALRTSTSGTSAKILHVHFEGEVSS